MNKEFFYIRPNKYILGGCDSISSGENVFEMSFFDLANNYNLLLILNLVQLGKTYEERGKFFASYISQMNMSVVGRGEYLKTNPTVKLLIIDKQIIEKLKHIKL
jgi:hypothetical protein